MLLKQLKITDILHIPATEKILLNTMITEDLPLVLLILSETTT